MTTKTANVGEGKKATEEEKQEDCRPAELWGVDVVEKKAKEGRGSMDVNRERGLGWGLRTFRERKGKRQDQTRDSSQSLCTYYVSGVSLVLHTFPRFKEGQPTEEETQVQDLIIPHICILCYIVQHASHTFVITSDPATPLWGREGRYDYPHSIEGKTVPQRGHWLA